MHLFQLYTDSIQVGFLYFFFCRAVRLGGPAGWPFSDQWWPWPSPGHHVATPLLERLGQAFRFKRSYGTKKGKTSGCYFSMCKNVV